ncbi:carbohydrate sulfotransferase 9-like [Mya arenaria]|uniref:carbohydrate sulfotransferase 9-like n=1 Tax=Mya arenaria TaxID=6604 RepID=UPI0022E3EDD5|nr:carbohydrate sulfotransferase 9-like [Mya arenaria]XP_052804629.1 carbohydrate sulfotransferase 9-like [Mya arenaria]
MKLCTLLTRNVRRIFIFGVAMFGFYSFVLVEMFARSIKDSSDSQGNNGQPQNQRSHNHIQTIDKSLDNTPELLANRVKQRCHKYQPSIVGKRRYFQFPVTTNKQNKLMFCPMCKLASTYWTRFFRLLDVKSNKTYITPYDVPISEAPATSERLTVQEGVYDAKFVRYYKFLFVRDPYSRLLSAYVDKIFAPNPTFWSIFKILSIKQHGKTYKVSRCGADISFEDYVRIVIRAHSKSPDNTNADCHDKTFNGACHPCEVRYDFIGKMETFPQDSTILFQKLKLNDTIKALNIKGKQLADEDALLDTVISPFLWKAEIVKCIPWREALLRIWRKLQVRGVIGKQEMPLSEPQAQAITKEEFIKLIKDTQPKTSFTERKKQRREAMIEIYGKVRLDYLKQIQEIYRKDFDLFEYNSDNQDIFHVNRSYIKQYGFLEV